MILNFVDFQTTRNECVLPSLYNPASTKYKNTQKFRINCAVSNFYVLFLYPWRDSTKDFFLVWSIKMCGKWGLWIYCSFRVWHIAIVNMMVVVVGGAGAAAAAVSLCVSFFYSFLCQFSLILRYSSVVEICCKTTAMAATTTTMTEYAAHNRIIPSRYWGACMSMESHVCVCVEHAYLV